MLPQNLKMPFWNTQVFLQFILFALNKLKVLLWGKLAWTLSHYWWFTQNKPQWRFSSINVFVQVVYDKFNCQGFVWEPFRMWLFCYKKTGFATMRDCRFSQAVLAHNIGWNWQFNIELIFYLSLFGTGHPFHPLEIQTLKDFKRLNRNFGDELRWEGRTYYKNVCQYILFLYSRSGSRRCFVNGGKYITFPKYWAPKKNRLIVFWRLSSNWQILGNSLPWQKSLVKCCNISRCSHYCRVGQ